MLNLRLCIYFQGEWILMPVYKLDALEVEIRAMWGRHDLTLWIANVTMPGAAIWACPAVKTVSSNPKPASVIRCAVHKKGENMQAAEMPRREALTAMALGGALSWLPGSLVNAASLPPGPPSAKLCDGDCEKGLDNVKSLQPRLRFPLPNWSVPWLVKVLGRATQIWETDWETILARVGECINV